MLPTSVSRCMWPRQEQQAALCCCCSMLRHGAKEDIFTHAFLGDLGALEEDLAHEPSSAPASDPAVDALEITPVHHAIAGGVQRLLRRPRDRSVGDNDKPGCDQPVKGSQCSFTPSAEIWLCAGRRAELLYCAHTQRRLEFQSFSTVSAMYRPARELSRRYVQSDPTPNIFLNKDRLAFDYCTCLVTLIKMSVGGQYGGIVLPFSGTMASDNASGRVAQRLRVATARSGTRHDRLRAE